MGTNRSKGFTLIELLIVIAIIAILALIAIPNFLEAQMRAKVSRVKADMRNIGTAIEAYVNDYNVPPLSSYVYITPTPPYEYAVQHVGWMTAQSRLTTPVSYTTSIPPDPFQDRDLNRLDAQGAQMFPDNCFIDGGKRGSLAYRYEASPAALWRHNDSQPWYNDQRRLVPQQQANWQTANGITDWMLMSSGPDLDSWSGYRQVEYVPLPTPAPLPPANARFLVPWPHGSYDPTNGTVSWGAIRRTGSTSNSD